jgi:hypothetical protein
MQGVDNERVRKRETGSERESCVFIGNDLHKGERLDVVLICIKGTTFYGIAIKGMGMPCTLQSGPCTSEATKSARASARGQVLERDGGWCEKKTSSS